jgi:nucleoside-specific outer membrane channel protein Tsx
MGYFRLFLVTLFIVTSSKNTALAQDAAGERKEVTQSSASTKDNAGPTAKQPFFLWMDNSVTVLPYGWGYEVDPSDQSTITFEHAHESAIGDLFFFVDGTKFHSKRGDDWTWYGELSPRFSVGKLLKKDLSLTFFRRSLFEFKDVLLAGQYERGEDRDQAEAGLLGIGFDLDVREAGILGRLGKFNYVQLNLYARAELTKTQRSGFRDMQITMVAAYPFAVSSSRILIDGYFDWVLGIGSEESSFHLNPQIKLDLGNYWGKPEKFYIGVELDFWWNKYQVKNSPSFDSNQQAVSLLMKYHF